MKNSITSCGWRRLEAETQSEAETLEVIRRIMAEGKAPFDATTRRGKVGEEVEVLEFAEKKLGAN